MQNPKDGQDRIWTYFQNSQWDSFSGAAPRIDYILRKIEKFSVLRDFKVLNIGSGNGYLEKNAMARQWHISALDPDVETIERLRRSGVHAQNGRIEKMPFEDGVFDVVIASEVLEHLNDDQLTAGLNEVFRVLSEKGTFVGTVPFREDLNLNRVICPTCNEIFHRWGHHQSFGFSKLRDVLADCGFSVKSLKRRAFVAFRGRGPVGFSKSCLRWLLGLAGENISSPNLFFIAKKERE